MAKPVSYSMLTAFELCPFKFHEERIAKKYPFVQNEAALYGERVHKAFENYLRLGKDLPEDLAKYLPMLEKFRSLPGQKYIEEKLGADRLLGKSDFWGKNTHIRCIVDYMKVDGKGALIVDFKTGRFSDNTDQLRLSAIITMANFPMVETVRGIYWYKKTQSLVHMKLTQADLLPAWAGFTGRIHRLERAVEEDKWPETPNFLCKNYCPVKECKYNG